MNEKQERIYNDRYYLFKNTIHLTILIYNFVFSIQIKKYLCHPS